MGNISVLGLFDRLASSEKRPVRSHNLGVSSEQILQSIKRNLELVLNTKKGCSLSSPELGLEDFNDAVMGSADMYISIAKDIKRSIDTYEPRVRVESVAYHPSDMSPFQIGFKLMCIINVSHKHKREEIELLLDKHSSRFQVS